MAFNKQKALEKAERFAAKGQHDRAAREYRAIAENEPSDIRAWLILADCLVRCEDKAQAIETYLRVAATYTEQREAQKAVAVYRQILNIDPSRLDVHFQVAMLNRSIGRNAEAVQGFEYVGQVQLQAGQIDDALDCYRLAAESDPESVPKRLRLAELYSREGKADFAVESFRTAAHSLLDQGRMEDFLRVGERLLYHRKDDLPMLRTLAGAYLRLGDPRRALMRLNSLLHAAPTDLEGLELLTDTFAALEKPEKAVSVIVELVREIRGQGGPHQEQVMRRVVRKGLGWDPEHEELMRLAAELGVVPDDKSAGVPTPQESTVQTEAGIELGDDQPETDSGSGFVTAEIEELDLDEGEMVELGEGDVLLDDEPAAGAGTGRGSAMAASDAPPGLVGLDRVVYEAGVYAKYRLFDHALEHVQEALDQDSKHLDALRLRAEALHELGRGVEAAMTFVELARIVDDPATARSVLESALVADPGHAAAATMLASLPAGGAAPGGDVHHEHVAASPATTDEFDISLESTAIPIGRDGPDLEEHDAAASTALAESVEETPATDELDLDQLVDLEPDDEFSDDSSEIHADTTEFGTPSPLSDDEPTVQHESVASGDDDDEFAIELHEPDAPPEPDAPNSVEDRFGLSEPHLEGDADVSLSLPDQAPGDSAAVSTAPSFEGAQPLLPPAESLAPGTVSSPDAEPPGGWPDVADEVAEVRFFLDQGLDDDARFAFEDLKRRFPAHPEVVTLEPLIAQPQVLDEDEEAAKPLVSLDEEMEDEDAYLAAIFEDSPSSSVRKPVQLSAHADIEDGDAGTHFDLGTAYREMGLIDDAIAQFELAAKDVRWRAKALVMLGTLRLHRGEMSLAIDDLRQAIAVADTEDELSEARYELGLVLTKTGDVEAAIRELEKVPEGFRERNKRLSDLRTGPDAD